MKTICINDLKHFETSEESKTILSGNTSEQYLVYFSCDICIKIHTLKNWKCLKLVFEKRWQISYSTLSLFHDTLQSHKMFNANNMLVLFSSGLVAQWSTLEVIVQIPPRKEFPQSLYGPNSITRAGLKMKDVRTNDTALYPLITILCYISPGSNHKTKFLFNKITF